MPLVDNALGAVPIENIDRQEQGGWEKLERGMCLDQEVQEIGTHEPLDFRLDINRLDIRKSGNLGRQVS